MTGKDERPVSHPVEVMGFPVPQAENPMVMTDERRPKIWRSGDLKQRELELAVFR
jgi:hypothetical protein